MVRGRGVDLEDTHLRGATAPSLEANDCRRSRDWWGKTMVVVIISFIEPLAGCENYWSSLLAEAKLFQQGQSGKHRPLRL